MSYAHRFVWKCQKCGSESRRSTPAPPRQCLRCLDKGVQHYVGKEPKRKAGAK